MPHFIPGRGAGGGREFFNHDRLKLREGGAAAVNLQTDVTIERDHRIGFGVIKRGDAIDPGAQTRAFDADAVVIPIINLHGGHDGGEVGGFGDDSIAPGFVVEFSPPRIARINLVAGHLSGLRHAQAPQLHAAVNKANLRITR